MIREFLNSFKGIVFYINVKDNIKSKYYKIQN